MKQNKFLENIHKKILTCHRCPLFKTTLHAVPGEGDPYASIMFIGEAPGRYEDETGRPFVGRAGKLLDKLLESIGLERKDVFITSVVKHRPPLNRLPKPTEIAKCSKWLDIQLSTIKPKIIVTLGRIAMDFFLPKNKISEIHGTIQPISKDGREYKIYPVYHPAAGLRSTRNKNKLFEDFMKLRKEIRKIGNK